MSDYEGAGGLEFKTVTDMCILWLPTHVQDLPAPFPEVLFGLTGVSPTDNQFEAYPDLFTHKRYSKILLSSFLIPITRGYFNNTFVSETCRCKR